MKQPGRLLKLATIASSVWLVSTFVAYRAGAFHGLMGLNKDRPPVMSGSNSTAVAEPAVPPDRADDGAQTAPAFMNSSKTGLAWGLYPASGAAGAQPTDPANPSGPAK